MFKTHFDSVQKVWSGNKTEFTVEKTQNFGEIILKQLSDGDSERVLQIDGDTGEALTQAEVRRRTIRFAQNLRKFGLTPEHRIAIIARNHHNLTPLLFAAFCIGSPISSLDVAGDGMSMILQRLQPSFIFCDADVLKAIENVINEFGLQVKLFTVNKQVDSYDSIDSLMSGPNDDESFVCTKIIDAYSHAAVIPCSSGSTGLSKSVCISHAVLTHAFAPNPTQNAFVALNFSSLYWLSGIWSLIGPAFKGSRIFTAKPFSDDLFFDLVEKYKVQMFFGPPSQLQAFSKSERCKTADLSSFLVCTTGGSTLPSVIVKSLNEIIPMCMLIVGYGATEIGGVVSLTLPKELEEYPTSVGHLVQGIQIKIINEKSNEKCGINEEGEIYIKPPIPAMGYLNDDVANHVAFDTNGYFITGDIGYFDEAGRLYISGRKKEMFKVRNCVIWPTELENIIQKSPAVRYACVVNVFDDDIMSDLPAAVVVKHMQPPITEDDVYALIGDQLANYKRLDGGIYFVDTLPMTPSGKVLRSKVREMAQKFYQTKKQNQNSTK